MIIRATLRKANQGKNKTKTKKINMKAAKRKEGKKRTQMGSRTVKR